MPPEESEDVTRRRRINPRLRAADWNLVRFAAGTSLSAYAAKAVEEFPTSAGPVDYALCDGGRALGVVEAKKVTRGPEGVLTQAERYSRGLTQSEETHGDGFRVPFLYSSNGEIIWFHDVRHPLSRSREVSGFHTPTALKELLSRDLDDELAALATVPMNPQLRPYQVEANEAVERAIQARKRKMLLAMATGTGKTLTMVNETYRLMKSGVARRVLFLVDRKALAAQAVRAFASFEAEPGLKFDKIYEVYSQRFSREDFDDDGSFDPKQLPASYLTDPQLGEAFVYVSTIQRMTMNLLGRELSSFAQYRMKPAYARVTEALRALEELHDAGLAMDPIWDADVMRIQARRLGEAVNVVFPPSVRLFLALVVELRFRSELEGTPIEELEPAQVFWHHKIPGLGLWYPAWREVRHAGDEWDGTWFIPEVQSVFQEFRNSQGLSHPEEADHDVQMAPSVPGIPQEPERESVNKSGIDSKLGIREEARSHDEPSTGPIEAGQLVVPESREFVSGVGSGPEGPSAEEQLREWCEVRGITPKHLTGECRSRLLVEFRAGRTTETDRNGHVGLR